jgi:16S rRNA processing protein RimM
VTDDPVIVARVARAHGLNGGLLLDAETDAPEALFQTGRRLRVVGRGGGPDEIELATVQVHSGRWLVTATGIGDRTRAEQLRGAQLTVPRSELPDFPEDGILLHDLIGLRVVEGERELGSITDVYDMPQGPMLAVEVEGRERLIPYDEAFVELVDLEARVVVVDLPAGLLDI